MVSSNLKVDPEAAAKQAIRANSMDWGDRGWFYVSVRIGFFLWVRQWLSYLDIVWVDWIFVYFEVYFIMIFSSVLQVALLNLITISSTWARVIDVMDSEVCMLWHCMTTIVFEHI